MPRAATQAAAAAAAAAAAGSGVGVGGAAQELHGAEGVARCAFESATRLDSLDVHSLQLEAKLARTTTHYSLLTGRVVARGRAVTHRQRVVRARAGLTLALALALTLCNPNPHQARIAHDSAARDRQMTQVAQLLEGLGLGLASPSPSPSPNSSPSPSPSPSPNPSPNLTQTLALT